MNIRSLLEMKNFDNFRLIAGQNGLNREVSKICLLDYEIINPIEGQFWRNEFALTSLLAAKDNPALILEAIKYLLHSQCSGLAIKNVYYDTLPSKVIDYANLHNFPIFIFDNSVFFEDLIMDFRDTVKDLEKSRCFEERIDLFLTGKTSNNTEDITTLFIDLAGVINKRYKVIYFSFKTPSVAKRILKPIERYRSMENESVRALIKFHDGLLLIYLSDGFNDQSLNIDIKYIGISKEYYWKGESELLVSPDMLVSGIHQALSASQIAAIDKTDEVAYTNIGIYKLLLSPHNSEISMKIASDFLDPIVDYDHKHGTELFITACSFIENDGNISKVANALFQHNNTIRYRINTLKKIHNMEHTEGSFYEQLSLAIKIMKLKELYNK